MLTFENLCVASEVVKRELGLPFGEVRSLVAAPLFHVMGSANQLLPTLWTGGTAVIMPSFDVHRLARGHQPGAHQSTRGGARHLLASPAPPRVSRRTKACAGWATAQPRPRRTKSPASRPDFPEPGSVRDTGSPNPVAVSARCRTNTPSATATASGWQRPGADLTLLDPGVDGVAELLVRSPSVSVGYWQNPSATAEVFKDGWLHTGDLARIDDRGLRRHRRPAEGHGEPRRRKRLLHRGRKRPGRTPVRRGGGRRRRARRHDGREGRHRHCHP